MVKKGMLMAKKSAMMNRKPKVGRLLWDETTETNETEDAAD
jgi:hypothetical protein